MRYDKVFCLDTNIVLEDATQIIKISEENKNLIVLPETVVDELDTFKSGFNEINFQAREFGRMISDAEVLGTHIEGEDNDRIVMSLLAQGIRIDIISFRKYDLKDVDPKVLNDRKIIEVAKYAKKHYEEEVIFLSNDVMCRTRAITQDVAADGLHRDIETITNEFVKELDGLESGAFKCMEAKSIKEYDPDWKPENYCYLFRATDGNQKLAYIVNEQIRLIDEKVDFKTMPVKPLNMGQRFASAGMLDNNLDVCVIEALAGSGKTLLAISAGMAMVKNGTYDKIIYIRNSVESTDKAEEVGFLSGNDQKFIIYNYPLYDTLEFIAKKSTSKKMSAEDMEAKVEELTAKYKIETMWNGAIRGRTLSRAYVIIDEVQNFAKTSLQTTLSRLDKDCKVVCIGSNRQIDHPYINKYTNGLSTLIKSAKDGDEEVNLFGTELTKVVRGKITEWTERIFSTK